MTAALARSSSIKRHTGHMWVVVSHEKKWLEPWTIYSSPYPCFLWKSFHKDDQDWLSKHGCSGRKNHVFFAACEIGLLIERTNRGFGLVAHKFPKLVTSIAKWMCISWGVKKKETCASMNGYWSCFQHCVMQMSNLNACHIAPCLWWYLACLVNSRESGLEKPTSILSETAQEMPLVQLDKVNFDPPCPNFGQDRANAWSIANTAEISSFSKGRTNASRL